MKRRTEQKDNDKERKRYTERDVRTDVFMCVYVRIGVSMCVF